MTSETDRLKSKLATLSGSLDELEEQLAPLFAQSLPEVIVNLETIQKAKLETVLPYLVYDLIFIYLKSRGIDPKTHPVVPELDRVRQYFEKISKAENPVVPRNTIDKAAAGRFIKHAITQAKWTATAAEAPEDSSDAGPSTITRVPVKMTSKMLEREQYEKEIKEQDARGSEEEDLEDLDDTIEEDAMEVDNTAVIQVVELEKKKKGKGKGKREQREVVVEEETTVAIKHRRPAVDPFAGYDDNVSVDGNPSGTSKTKTTRTTEPTVSTADVMRADRVTSQESTVTQMATTPAKAKARKAKRKKSA